MHVLKGMIVTLYKKRAPQFKMGNIVVIFPVICFQRPKYSSVLF